MLASKITLAAVLVSVLWPPGTADPSRTKLRIRFPQTIKTVHHYHTVRQYAKNFGYHKPPTFAHKVPRPQQRPRWRPPPRKRNKHYRGVSTYAKKYRNWVPRPRQKYRGHASTKVPQYRPVPARHEEVYDEYSQPNNNNFERQYGPEYDQEYDQYEDEHRPLGKFDRQPTSSLHVRYQSERGRPSIHDEFNQQFARYQPNAYKVHEDHPLGAESVRNVVRRPYANDDAVADTTSKRFRPQQDEYTQAFHAFSYRGQQPGQHALTSRRDPVPAPSNGDHDIGFGEGLEDVNEGVYGLEH